MTRARSEFIDFAKGYAILLVVLGHSVQIVEEAIFFESFVFVFIYSFHMPLFISISGYLFYSTVTKKSLQEIFCQRFKSLVIPTIIWTMIMFLLYNYQELVYPQQDKKSLLKSFIGLIPRFYWFLPILFASMILLATFLSFRITLFIQFLVFTVLLFLPDISSFAFLKYLFPFFVIGYLFNKFNLVFIKISPLVILLFTLIFLAFLIFWRTEFFIYNSGMEFFRFSNLSFDLKQIYVNIYRYLAGLFGVAVNLFFLHKAYVFLQKKFMLDPFLKIGSKSLGIYMIHLLVVFHPKVIFLVQRINPNKYFMIIFIAGFLIIFSFVCTNLIEKSAVLRKVLFGVIH
ncbi:acyltransferase family protein [Dyadobacter psychrotolerans]|uniref:Acyltransferase 3 domain-containing protein n=1 Tax=Dyadobacter psychrotolerans TaxID=2541721 RepID=A0A4R5DAR0_9BACT|nr:hypothetical protein E0F88_32525 [Dyadobacter psychrotolerans]